jgi:lipoprotein NlpD
MQKDGLKFSSVVVRGGFCAALGSLLLAACTITGYGDGYNAGSYNAGNGNPGGYNAPPPAPVSPPAGNAAGLPPPETAMAAPPPSGPVPAGYYRVQISDTLYRIALDNGQNYRDIAAWNNLADPAQIKVGQLLRVAPPDGTGVNRNPEAAGVAPVTAGAPPVADNDGVVVGGAIATPPVYNTNSNGELQPARQPQESGSGGIALQWPVRGPVLARFDGSKNKGIDIGGTAGEPVKAAAGGKVVYAGNGLRGYGNLVIIKHNATFLTAYAHNRSLMVKERDVVTKGQGIATMGRSDADRVALHFEVRRLGKPVNPVTYLPPR